MPTLQAETKRDHMPQIFPYTNKPDDTELYFWLIGESAEELASLIPGGDSLLAEAHERFKAPKRQCEWLAVRALLQQTPHKRLEILYQNGGKPYFGNSDKHISISHTQEFAAIAIAGRPIGIDIESPERNAHAVASAFLQPQEMEALPADGDQKREAVRLWSVKEAAFKLAPEKAAVLKEILAQPITESTTAGRSYRITFKDGTTALCRVAEEADFILSICIPE